MAFSSSVQVSLDVQVIYTFNKAAFPSDGESQITTALVEYINGLGLGATLYNYKLYAPLNAIPGILTIDINTRPANTDEYSNQNLVVSEFQKLVTTKDRFHFFPEDT